MHLQSSQLRDVKPALTGEQSDLGMKSEINWLT